MVAKRRVRPTPPPLRLVLPPPFARTRQTRVGTAGGGGLSPSDLPGGVHPSPAPPPIRGPLRVRGADLRGPPPPPVGLHRRGPGARPRATRGRPTHRNVLVEGGGHGMGDGPPSKRGVLDWQSVHDMFMKKIFNSRRKREKIILGTKYFAPRYTDQISSSDEEKLHHFHHIFLFRNRMMRCNPAFVKS